jgi:hypothetical protein
MAIGSFLMEDSFKWVAPDVSGNGGVYKSLIDSVNKQDDLCLAFVLPVAAHYFLWLDDYPAGIEYARVRRVLHPA